MPTLHSEYSAEPEVRVVRRFLTLSSGLFSLSLAAVATAAPPRMVVDVPSSVRVSASHPVDSAKKVLTRSAGVPSGVQLSFQRERRIGGLRVLRFQQEHQGVPVFGRGAGIAFDVYGVTRLATSKIEYRLPESVVPVVSASQAASAASKISGLLASDANTRLIIWPTEQGARLAYSVLPPSLIPVPYAPVVIVDAVTGQVITVHNLVRYENLANVHEFNPVSSPDLSEVTLPIDDPHTVPQNELLVSYNCVDMQTTKTVNYSGFNVEVHVCEMLQNAEADATTGDYTQHVLEDHTSGGDPHAQVAIFYHAAKAYDFFKTFDSAFELEDTSNPLFLVANLMLPAGLMDFDLTAMADPNTPLEPFANAMSVSWDPLYGDLLSSVWPEITGGSLMLGQATTVDFSYDGDIVYHEFGHSVVATTIGSMGYWHLDEQGATAAPGSMNEALADYFSTAITNDPATGEYAAQEDGSDYIRHLENDHVCPSHLAGEVHYDSEFFSASLWAARSALSDAAERHAFDEAIFTALNTAASGEVSYQEMADVFVASVAASTLGQTVADSLEGEFSSRGVLPSCDRIFVYEDEPISSLSEEMANHFVAGGKNGFINGSALEYAPGIIQVQVTVPAGATKMDASFGRLITSSSSLPFGNSDPFTPAFIVSWDEPISFDWDANTSNASDPIETSKVATRYASTFDVPDGAQTAYVMVVNKGDEDGYYTSVKVDFTNDAEDAGADAEVDAGTEPDAGDVDAGTDAGGQPSEPGATSSDSDDDGCGCRTASSSGNGFSLAALIAMIGLGIARRRRNGTIRS